MKKISVLFLLGFVLLSLTSAAQASKLIEKIAGGEINWETGMITVTGEGAPPMKTISLAQARAMAKRAAIADGYRKLAEIVNGVRVDAETVVKNYVTENDEVRIKVEALIKGASIGDLKYLADGSVKIKVSLPLYGDSSVGEVIYPVEVAAGISEEENTSDNALPATAEAGAAGSAVASAVTGLIIDVRGTDFMPAMSPKVVSEDKTVVYIEPKELDLDYVINVGIAGFAETPKEAKAAKDRIGANPLVVKAKGVEGSYKANAIILNAEAEKILSEVKKTNFLKKCSVIFIVS